MYKLKKTVLLFFLLIIYGCTYYADGIRKEVIYQREFKKEIEQLDEIIRDHPESAKKAKAHLQLAIIYSYYKNPYLDYQKALSEIKKYISYYPESILEDDVKNLYAMLHEIDKLLNENLQISDKVKQLNDEINSLLAATEKLNDENKKLKFKLEQLNKENKEIKEKLEQLKNLDLWIEEMRKQIKQ